CRNQHNPRGSGLVREEAGEPDTCLSPDTLSSRTRPLPRVDLHQHASQFSTRTLMTSDSASKKAYRASIVHSLGDPAEVAVEDSYAYFEDGLMIVENGKISAVGHAADLLSSLDSDVQVLNYKDALISAGFIDTHIHLPQTGMVGSYGEQLL